MTLAHFIYIPAVVVLAGIIGYVLGGRAAVMAREEKAHKDERRAARQKAREARDRARASGASAPPSADPPA